MNIKEAKDKLADELIFSNKYPEVQGVGIVSKNHAPAIEIMFLKGKNHDRVLKMFPQNKYNGFPICFAESAQIIAQFK